MKKIKFYLILFFKNEKLVGFCEILIFITVIITAIFWWKDDSPGLEPFTIILTAIGLLIDVTKRIITKPKFPKITFTEYSSNSSRESSFFIGTTLTSLKDAKKAARENNKGIFLVIYDKEHPTNSQLNYSLGYFTSYDLTKRLINDNFIQIILPSDEPSIQKYIPDNYHMENCLLVVFDRQDRVIRTEGVYANSDEGLRIIREDISKLK